MADDGASDEGWISPCLIAPITTTAHKWPRDLLVLEAVTK